MHDADWDLRRVARLEMLHGLAFNCEIGLALKNKQRLKARMVCLGTVAPASISTV